MARRLSEAFGATSVMDLDLVRAVAEAAAFETAHAHQGFPFCAALTATDRRVLDIFEGRHRPFFKGYERFRNVCAPLAADMAASLRASAAASRRRSPQGRGDGDDEDTSEVGDAVATDLRFAHAETLVPLLLLLGVRSNGLAQSDPHFRLGLAAMSPFAANLALELYVVRNAAGDVVEHLVRFRLHERYVECIPALGKRGATSVVKLEHLLEFFDAVVEDVSFD